MFSDFNLHCRFWKQRLAIVEARSDLRLSYRDLAESISAFGTLLDQRGIEAGARITIVARSSFQTAIAVLACLGNGVVANPLKPDLPGNLVAEFINNAGSSLLLTDDLSLVPLPLRDPRRVLSVEESVFPLVWKTGIQKLSRPISEGGLLIYTAGTTGFAKGVLLSLSNIKANTETAAAAFGYKPGWISGCLLPLYHTFGLISDVLPVLLNGGTVIALPTFEMSHAKLTANFLKKYKIQSYSAAPGIFEAFTALNCLANTHLQFAVSGAAPLDECTKADYEARFGHPIIPCYSLSESTCFATISPPAAARANSAGKPANAEICVLDKNLLPLAPGQMGELALRGPSVIRNGYYRDHKNNASAYTHDGWLLTGDIGRIDADGYVYVTGRKKVCQAPSSSVSNGYAANVSR